MKVGIHRIPPGRGRFRGAIANLPRDGLESYTGTTKCGSGSRLGAMPFVPPKLCYD
jgi:hypothetical protein